jgi:hypothetical protein
MNDCIGYGLPTFANPVANGQVAPEADVQMIRKRMASVPLKR